MTFLPGANPYGCWVGRIDLTATPPAGPAMIINQALTGHPDLAAIMDGTAGAAVGLVVISWSRPSARDDCEPSTMTLTVLTDSDTEPALVFGSEVSMDGQIHQSGTVFPESAALFRGWVESTQVERVETVDQDTAAKITVWRHTVSCTDIIGRAAATKIGDSPWPWEAINSFSEGRMLSIEGATPYQLLDPDHLELWASNSYAVERDVDNLPVLDALGAAVHPIFRYVHPGVAGIRLLTFPVQTMAPAWGMDAGEGQVLELDASMITDAPRTINRAGLVNAYTLTYTTAPTALSSTRTEASLILRSIGPGQSTAEVSTESDLLIFLDVLSDELAAHQSYADSLFELTAAPTQVMGPVRLLDLRASRSPVTIDPLRTQNVRWLVDIDTRTNQAVKITGETGGVFPYQHIIAGELVISGDPFQQSLTVTMNPTTLAGQRPLKIGDFGYGRWPNTDIYATIGGLEYSFVTIGDTEMSTMPYDGVL